MPTNNGRKETTALEEYQSLLLKTNQQVTDILVDFALGYQKAAESTLRLSFANLKALTNIANTNKE